MDEIIRVWYVKNYPTDDLGEELSEVTFKDFFAAVAMNKVYETMGVADSLVRERLFERLSKLLGRPYGFIYDMWLEGATKEVI